MRAGMIVLLALPLIGLATTSEAAGPATGRAAAALASSAPDEPKAATARAQGEGIVPTDFALDPGCCSDQGNGVGGPYEPAFEDLFSLEAIGAAEPHANQSRWRLDPDPPASAVSILTVAGC